MLPKKDRFTRENFDLFLKQNPFSAFNTLGTLRFLPGAQQFTVVVSSKHAKRAIRRNKAKRRAYTIVAAFMKDKKPFTGILYLSKHAHTLSFTEFEGFLKELLVRAYERIE